MDSTTSQVVVTSGDVTIRRGKPGDYPSFLAMEQQAWKDTGVSLISKGQFLTWLEIYPEGLFLAEREGKIVGHFACQRCDFDPTSVRPNQGITWDKLTDLGSMQRTHKPDGFTFYPYSLSCTYSQAFLPMFTAALEQAEDLGVRYCGCHFRLPGLAAHAKVLGDPVTYELAERYVAKVTEEVKRPHTEQKLQDATLSPCLAAKTKSGWGLEVYHVLPGYFSDAQSGDFACGAFHGF